MTFGMMHLVFYCKWVWQRHGSISRYAEVC